MKLMIDGAPASFEVEGAGTLRDLLFLLEEKFAAGGGRVILGVMVDGRTLTQHEQETWGERRLEELGELELLTAEPRALALTTLRDARTILGLLAEALERSADLFRAGRRQEALKGLEESLIAWEWATDALQKAGAVLGIDSERLETEGVSLDERYGRLGAQLREVALAFEGDDVTLVSDLIQWELVPELRGLGETVESILPGGEDSLV